MERERDIYIIFFILPPLGSHISICTYINMYVSIYTCCSLLPNITAKSLQFHGILKEPFPTPYLFPVLKILHYFLLVHCTSPEKFHLSSAQKVPSILSLLPKNLTVSRTLVSSAVVSRGSNFSSSPCTTGPGVGALVPLCCFQTIVPSAQP